MTTHTTTQYVNVYRDKEGINFGIITDTPELAASYVCLADGHPICLLKLEWDDSKTVGQRIRATEITQ
jgi:hypothetical protein